MRDLVLIGFNPLFEGDGVEAADFAVEFGAVFIDDSGGDALNAGFVGGLFGLVDVALIEVKVVTFGGHFIGNFDKVGTEALAVSAPRGEVFDDDETVLIGFFLIILISKLFEFFHKNLSKVLVKHE